MGGGWRGVDNPKEATTVIRLGVGRLTSLTEEGNNCEDILSDELKEAIT